MAEGGRGLLWPSVAAALLLAVTLAAGKWQLDRAEYKRALQARIDARLQAAPIALDGRPVDAAALQGRRVQVTGRFDSAHEIFLDNRSWEGHPAYQVLTPLLIEGASVAVLIDRGRVIRDWNGPLPVVPVPPAPVRIDGIAGPPPGKYLELSRQVVQGKVWQNLDLPRYAATLPYSLLPVVVTQLNDTGDGLHRQWVRPDTGVEKHLGYAFQWFAMAATIVILYVVLYARRCRARQSS
ncbi:SURF1 family protein [Thiobacter aerophilum]|uniref:SURF1-like protein n=1 Tax=Thiobacter aerophilum TaxID=3121275 RepID=A0ABV0EEJ2_9BURK